MTAGSLPRAIVLLRTIAQSSADGVRINRLIDEADLPRGTVYRILNTLMEAGWVERRADDMYYFGPDFSALAEAASLQQPLPKIAAQHLKDLRNRIGHTIYLTVRSGMDAVCVSRYESEELLRMLVFKVGSRVPLGFGAGGMSLMAYLPENETDVVIRSNHQRYNKNRLFDEEAFRTALAETREKGFAFHVGLFTTGVAGIGVPVFGEGDQPVAAISTAFLADWENAERHSTIASKMRATAETIARDFRLHQRNNSKLQSI